MDVTSTSRWLIVVAAACASLFVGACTDPRVDAAGAIEAELAAREARSARSAELCGKGLEAFERSDLPQARRHLEAAIDEDDRNARAWMALGALEFRQDNLYEAARAFHRAARLEPTRFEPHYNLGTVLEAAGLYSQAVKEYEIALKRAPDRLAVMENLARCYIKAGAKPEKARQLIHRALEIEDRPDWLEWLHRQASRLQQTGDGRENWTKPQEKGELTP